MSAQTYEEKRASQAAQVALEFARQMGGTFVTNTQRKDEFVTRDREMTKEK